MGCVYLLMSTDIEGKNELFKIGITKGDVNKRIKSLSTGNPNKIILLETYYSCHYKKIEKWLHGKFFNQKTQSNNEWFLLKNEDVFNFKKTCEEGEKIFDLLTNNNIYFNNTLIQLSK